MTQMLANRLTTVPQQFFSNCVSLSLREEDLTASDLSGLQGGNPRLVQYVLENLPKAQRTVQQTLNRGMPPVVYAAFGKFEQIGGAILDTCDSVLDVASDAITDFENGVKSGWYPGKGYGG